MLRKLILILLGLAIGGMVYLAQKRARETGRTIIEVLPEVPADAQRLLDQAVARVKEAVQAGCEAATEKQAEIQSILDGAV